MPYITTRDNTSIYVKDWGVGEPVILIHGWPLNSDSWDPVSNELANSGYRVIAYDRRGFGRSDQPDSGYDYDTLSDDLADVMQALNITNNATIIGFSMGGGEVARYMSRHAGKGVVKAGLISSVVPHMLKTEDNPDGVPEEKLNEIAENIKTDRTAFFRSFLKEFYGVGLVSHPVSEEVLDWSWNLCMQAGIRPTLACAKAFGTTDFRADLSAFKVPTLIIHGTKDKTVPIEATGHVAAERIAQSQLIEYSGEPHGIFATEQTRLINDIKEFLES